MSALAAIRPDDLDLALFVHVLGAMAMFGALVMAASYLVRAGGAARSRRSASDFAPLLYVGLPAFIVMRVGAQWIADEEGLADSDAQLDHDRLQDLGRRRAADHHRDDRRRARAATGRPPATAPEPARTRRLAPRRARPRLCGRDLGDDD